MPARKSNGMSYLATVLSVSASESWETVLLCCQSASETCETGEKDCHFVSGFWCHCLEPPASPRRICAVTRGFQTMTRDLSVFLSYQDTIYNPGIYQLVHPSVCKIVPATIPTNTLSYGSCVTIDHYCLETCGPCNN